MSNSYYKDLPRIRPISDYLNKEEANEKIKIVIEKLKQFQSSQNWEVISLNSVTTYINQFSDDLQPIALDFITHIELYDRDLLVNKIRDILKKIKENNKKIGIAFLGNQTDSASLFPYYLRDKIDIDRENVFLSDLSDNLLRQSDKIIIYDDNINSGLQLINILAELLG
ncbi:MAG: hypothetical protein FWF73_02370 [Spirochaetes bacterium]|nr:hypothetical protein [Spirochaetota bacterium]